MTKTVHTEQNKVLLQLLREFRQRRQLRQEDVAARMGWTQTALSNVERGERRLDVLELRAWLLALEVDHVEFVRCLEERLST